jgi:hypothetical protein
MGETIALAGFLGLALGGTGFLKQPFRVLGLTKAQSAAIAVIGALALLVGGVILLSNGQSPDPRTRARSQAERRIQATLGSYLQTNAPTEASFVRQYHIGSDFGDLLVRTNLAPAHQSLEAGQRICELARNVILEVRVVTIDGTTLWGCDRVNSRGNAQLVALAEQQAAAEAEAARLAQEQADAAAQQEREAQVAAQRQTRRPAAQPARSSQRAPAPAAAPASDCHPSYEGECLPNDASDVDCIRGTGKGPVYAYNEDIRIVGPDVFGLDGDDDGLGCDSRDRDGPAPEPEPAPLEEAPPPAESTCHPSYEGECLPIDASDVDCVDGDGNGPVYAYTHNIRVVGPDVFDLDADDDGLGCDS